MNNVYSVDLNGSDFQIGGLALSESQSCLPAVNCEKCGENGVNSMLWRPDWNLSSEFQKTVEKGNFGNLDSKAISIREFNRDIIPNIEGSIPDSRVVAGTFYGNKIIHVPVKAATSELKRIHLRNRQPIISGGPSKLCSREFAEVISIDRHVRLVEVKLRVEDGDVPYYVFCERHVPAWSQEEWDSHGMTVCSSCGSIMYKKYPKTYTQKRIRREWFEDGPSIVQSQEHRCLLVNESMKNLLAPISARIKFSLYGSW